MPQSAPSDHRQKTDYIYVGIVCVCVLLITLSVGVGVTSLQRLLAPDDSLLFGATESGELMLLIPITTICSLASFRIAWVLTKWIRRRFGMPEIARPFPVAPWERSFIQSINWPLVGGIAGVIFMLVAATGFVSYFCVTESGLSVRPPLEFSMRHYEWKDVTAVRVRCIRSIAKTQNRFRYILRMSDGYEVELTSSLSAPTEERRAVYAARFAESIPSHLNTVPGIVYEFDVSREGLAQLGEKRGILLPNAIREQVLSHGGTLQ